MCTCAGVWAKYSSNGLYYYASVTDYGTKWSNVCFDGTQETSVRVSALQRVIYLN